MNHRQPPALALWLLDRLGSAGANAPLVGDLLEEFRGRRSVGWFWRQTLIAIAHGIGRRVALQRIYWIAVALGFAAQLPFSLLLFHLRLPPPAHGLGGKAAEFLLLLFGIMLMPLLGRWAFGKTAGDLKRILIQPGGGFIEQRSALMSATAFESFGCILLLYCICCLIFPTPPFSSYAEVIGAEFVWLGIGEAASGFLLASARRRESRKMASEHARETRGWSYVREAGICLVCSDGAIIHIEPETCMETIFASANPELIASLLTGGTRAEQIRRAIWLAAAADICRPRPDAISGFAPVPVAEFAGLLERQPESERMRRYLKRRN